MKSHYKIILSMLIVTAFVFPSSVHADLMNPEFLTKKCRVGEKEIICSFKSEEPFGPRTTDGCTQYAKDKRYYYLTGHASSFGGGDKYCLKIEAQTTTQVETKSSEQKIETTTQVKTKQTEQEEETKIQEEETSSEPYEQNNSLYLLGGAIVLAIIGISFGFLSKVRKNVTH